MNAQAIIRANSLRNLAREIRTTDVRAHALALRVGRWASALDALAAEIEEEADPEDHFELTDLGRGYQP